MDGDIAKQYLNKYRKLESVLEKLGKDIRTNEMWDSKQYYPAAFARDKKGNITGGQSIYLNKETANKADIEVNKRSFGTIRGSFVEISERAEAINKQVSNSISNATIIAERLESALSIKESGIEGKILCSLGVNNIKNYNTVNGERIIIASDNDGKEAVTLNTVIKDKDELITSGAVVSVVMPPDKGVLMMC
ncbi:DUF7146 domain-containing protein [Rickettsia gravesii]|uniref:DUF7146 domain-containing protein n=1 Tax=Rickettsia gravesii TaxID=354585 RepID=UPI0004663A2A|nr:hypothetical protein [Rickettsia gravesii]